MCMALTAPVSIDFKNLLIMNGHVHVHMATCRHLL